MRLGDFQFYNKMSHIIIQIDIPAHYESFPQTSQAIISIFHFILSMSTYYMYRKTLLPKRLIFTVWTIVGIYKNLLGNMY